MNSWTLKKPESPGSYLMALHNKIQDKSFMITAILHEDRSWTGTQEGDGLYRNLYYGDHIKILGYMPLPSPPPMPKRTKADK